MTAAPWSLIIVYINTITRSAAKMPNSTIVAVKDSTIH
jgi:hypothetical protein